MHNKYVLDPLYLYMFSVTPSWLKNNLDSLSSAELNRALARFVREVRRPCGDSYAPDSIFYLCISIQKVSYVCLNPVKIKELKERLCLTYICLYLKHLQKKGRADDLFNDPCYKMFGEELNKILKDWQPSVLPDGN